MTSVGRRLVFLLISTVIVSPTKHAWCEAALLMEEPYGEFGRYNPTGHAAVYLSEVCAENPTTLRRCRPGEFGSVVSRYHKIHHQDWLAIPLTAYLYAVETPSEIPETVDRDTVAHLRDTYWRSHLAELAPSPTGDGPPVGEWIQLVGASYDRKIFGFAVSTTSDQDDRFIRIFNDRKNVGHFNLFFHNCADFSRVVLDTYYPKAIHRNAFGDFGMTTPKQAARSLFRYGRKHPELKPITFEIAQVSGTIPRSRPIEGVAEALVKSKKYLVPLAFLQPEVAGAIVVDYLTDDSARLPKTATAFVIRDWEVEIPNQHTASPD